MTWLCSLFCCLLGLSIHFNSIYDLQIVVLNPIAMKVILTLVILILICCFDLLLWKWPLHFWSLRIFSPLLSRLSSIKRHWKSLLCLVWVATCSFSSQTNYWAKQSFWRFQVAMQIPMLSQWYQILMQWMHGIDINWMLYLMN